ncbi:MAG: PAS domain S-box protein, partial [Desulfobacteraceae bacterium]
MDMNGIQGDKGAILQSIGDAVITTDVHGRITLMNPVAERLTGWRAEEAEGKALTEVFRIVHAQTGIPAENPVERVIETGGVVGLANHTMLIARDGTTCQIADSGAPILDVQGRVAGVVLVFRDVSKEYRMREHLRQSEAFLKSVFNSIQDGISVLNPDLSIRHANYLMKAWYAENLPLEGKKCFECYQNRDKPCDPCPSLRCLASGKTERDVVPGLLGSSVEWIELFSYPIRDEETGEITGVVEFVRDITERKKAEEALQAERRRLADVLEGTRAGIWEWNVRTGETVVDERWAEMVGYTLEELSPTTIETWQEMTHPADLEKAIDLLRRHLRGELDYYECEVRQRHKNGHWVWVLDRGKVTKWMEDGRPLLVSGTHQDITERKSAEQERKENERKLRTIVEHSNELYYIHDAKHDFTYVSPTSEALLGCSPEELRRRRFDMVTDNPINRKGLEITKTAIQTGEKQEPYLLEARRKDGALVWLEVDESPVKDSDGNVVAIAGAARDVTAQRQAEERLRASEQRFRALFNAISDVIFTHDLEGRFLSVNPALCSLFGYDEAEVIGKKISEFMKPEDASAFEAEYLAQIKERGYHEGTSAYLTREGERVFIEYRNSMVHPENGAPYISGTGRDVTERIRSEREVAKLQAHLAQAQKLESIGTLAGGIAHNFNNVLMGIQGRASLMMMDKDPYHPDYEHLKGIEEYVKNATELTRDLLGFARGGKYEVKPTDLNVLIQHENRMF